MAEFIKFEALIDYKTGEICFSNKEESKKQLVEFVKQAGQSAVTITIEKR